MNMFFVIGGEVITPALVGSILPGITRKSCIQILKDKGYRVTERRISIDEVLAAQQNGTLDEAFGTGTAAVISPVGLIRYRDRDYTIGGGKMGQSQRCSTIRSRAFSTGPRPIPTAGKKS